MTAKPGGSGDSCRLEMGNGERGKGKGERGMGMEDGERGNVFRSA